MAQSKARLAGGILALGAALALLSGCQDGDEIRQYKAPRVEYPKARMLGAIVPRADFMWFFKLEGAPDAVALQEKNYTAFIESLRFASSETEPLTWTAPPGWHHQAGAGMRFATFHMGERGKALELSVSKLDAKDNTVIDNVNRWRTGLGLIKVLPEELPGAVKEITVENEKVILVDILGDVSLVKKGGMKGKAPPMVAHQGKIRKLDVPPGWREVPPQNPAMGHVAAFKTGDVDIVVSRLGPQPSFLDNVNRWRGILKLGRMTDNQLAQVGRKIACKDGEADYIDIQGSPTGLRILAVMLELGQTTWFFRMTGKDADVGEQKAAFEKFVRSVSF